MDPVRRRRRLSTLAALVVVVGVLAGLLFLQQWKFDRGRRAEEGVRKILDDQVEAWNRGDLDSFMQGYWHSEQLTFFSEDKIEHGWQATMDRYQKRYRSEGKEMGKLAFSELNIVPIGYDSAVVRGRWKLQLTNGSPHGLFTLLFRRFPEGWRIVHDHTSAAPPPSKPAD